MAAAALFGLGGLVIGGIWLHRRGSLYWRRALLPSTFIGLGLGAAALSQLPLTWMNYQTTDSAANFLLMQFVSAGSVDRKSTRLNSSHVAISYAVFCLKKKNNN